EAPPSGSLQDPQTYLDATYDSSGAAQGASDRSDIRTNKRGRRRGAIDGRRKRRRDREGRWRMTKITHKHLARSAIVYIRQSSAQQVMHNRESKRRQYALVERGRQLGWGEIQIIDDDLGRTGDGGAARPGFEKLLAAICVGRVGAVLAIEASRLARNGRDWHTLLEFSGVVDTLIIDEDGIYDPRLPNDRLLLGMKGTMSEMECRFSDSAPARQGCRRLVGGSSSQTSLSVM